AKGVLIAGKTIREILAEQTDLSGELIAQTADPYLLTRPTRSRAVSQRRVGDNHLTLRVDPVAGLSVCVASSKDL
ncbi:hypothetical protein, partial [Mesorhizobium sp.]